MSEHERDLDYLSSIGAIFEDPDVVEATPSIAIRFTADGCLSTFPGRLDEVLARAHDLIAPTATFYGAEQRDGLGFPKSRGRRPRPRDRDCFADVSAIMRTVELAHREAMRRRRRHLLDQGMRPEFDPETMRVQDGGSIGLLEAFPIERGGSHIVMAGSAPWRVSIGFGLDLYRQRHEEIDRLAEDIAATGAFDSGCYGFALNVNGDAGEDLQRRLFRPLAARFPLLNPVDVLTMPITTLDTGDVFTLFPIGSWYFVAKPVVARFRISEEAVRALASEIFAVIEHPHSFLLKLYEQPVLGDGAQGADLRPAIAVSKALAPGFLHPEAWRLFGMSVGGPDDRLAWYRRFLGP